MTVGKTSGAKAAKSFEIADRRRRVALLMRAGWLQQEIAARLGVSEATVSGDVAALKARLREAAEEDIGEMVAQEKMALDGDEAVFREMLGQTRTRVEALRVYDTVLAIMRRRAELVGLDAASRRRGLEGGTSSELDALLREVLGERTTGTGTVGNDGDG